MSKAIRLYYFDGFYNLRDPLKTIEYLLRHRKLYHPVYNIGDQISPVVVAHFSGRPVRYAPPFRRKKMIAIGSVLAGVKPGDVAWGSGLMKAEHVKYMRKVPDFRIAAVRGPETRRVLLENGFECPEVYGDPGLLMPMIFPRQRSQEFSLGIIPHLSQIEEFGQRRLEKGTLLISPEQPWQEFISNICRCQAIVSCSLHGVILADAYGVPAVPMVHGEWLHGTPFKFQDYFRSTGREAAFMASSDELTEEVVRDKVAALGRPQIDLRPLISAFPYPLADSNFAAQGTYLTA